MTKKEIPNQIFIGIVTGVIAGIVTPLMLYFFGALYFESWATLSSEVKETEASLLGTNFKFVRQEALDPVSEEGTLVLNLNGEAKSMRVGTVLDWPPKEPSFVITLEQIELGSKKGAWVARFKIERDLW